MLLIRIPTSLKKRGLFSGVELVLRSGPVGILTAEGGGHVRGSLLQGCELRLKLQVALRLSINRELRTQGVRGLELCTFWLSKAPNPKLRSDIWGFGFLSKGAQAIRHTM